MLITLITFITKIPDRKQLKEEDLFWLTVAMYTVMAGKRMPQQVTLLWVSWYG